MKKQDIHKIYPLTNMQEGMLYFYVKGDNAEAYIEQFVFTLHGHVDLQRFEDSVNLLIERYEVLRTVFKYKKLSRNMQVVLKERKLAVPFEDLLSYSESEKLEIVRERKQKERTKGFNLSKDILLRVSVLKTEAQSYKVIWTHHHILMDGWCMSIIMNDFLHIYQSLIQGKKVHLPAVNPFSDYVNWLQNQDDEAAVNYWAGYIAGYEQTATIPYFTERQPNTGASYIKQEVAFTLGTKETTHLLLLAQQQQVTLNVVFQTIWGILLQAYNGTDDVLFGSVVSGRPMELAGIETMVGLFINTIPVRIQSDHNTTFAALVKQVQEQALQSGTYDYYSLAEIQGMSLLKQNLFQHIVVFENYPVAQQIVEAGQASGDRFTMMDAEVFEQTSYDFNVLVVPGEELEVKLVFNAQVYDPLRISRIEDHLRQIVAQVVNIPNLLIHDIQVVTLEERQEQLIAFNAARQTYSKHQTIQHRFEEQVELTPERTAVVWDNRQFNYQELNERANQLAHVLRAKGVKANIVVGLMTERSLDMIVGLLAIVKAGGAYLPIHPDDPIERIQFMLHDSQALLIVTQSHLSGRLSCDGEMEELLIDDEALFLQSCSNPESLNGVLDLAYVIYTSGSTGEPKGVLIEHAQVMNLVNGLQREIYGNTSDHLQVALLASYVFDASVQQIGSALLFGHTLHVLPDTCRKEPDTFMAYMREHGIHVCDGTPSHLAFLTAQQTIKGAEPAGISRLKHLLIGGESLSRHVVNTLWDVFPEPNLTIWNVYGPTETCVDAVIYPVNRVDFQQEQQQREAVVAQADSVEHDRQESYIPIGRPLPNVQCYIVGKYNQLLPIGAIGELCIGGDGLTRGYMNRSELTAAKFTDNPFVVGERMYRTGDLARWMPGGNLSYIGRNDQQVKIRGYRIETGEIEAKLLAHGKVQETAVIAFDEGNGHKALCAYVAWQGQDPLTSVELRTYLARSLPEYMIPSTFVSMDRLPLTPNGKLDHKALPSPQGGRNTGVTYAAPRDKREEALVHIWQDILRVERIGIYDNFFELGGHSLKAMSLAARIHKEMNVDVPLRDLFAYSTLEAMAAHIGKLEISVYSSIETLPEQSHYPVSSAQKRVYVLEQLEGLFTSYNMSSAFHLSGVRDNARFTAAFERMIQRHDVLRTSFALVNGEPIQHVHPSVPFTIEEIDLMSELVDEKTEPKLNLEPDPERAYGEPEEGWNDVDQGTATESRQQDIQSHIKRFIRPFDLSQAPLMRVGLLHLSGEEAILLVDMHHIISDGVSMELFVQEWVQLYRGEELLPQRIQYRDYAVWQREQLQGERMKQQEAYWLKQLWGELPVLNMPTDYPRPTLQSFEGGRVRIELERELTDELRQICAREGVTLSMVLLAAYQVLLAKYSGQEDVIVGVPIAGRPHADLSDMLGMFVNTLAMRSRPEGDKTFMDFLREVKENALQAYVHQDYPFEKVVEQLQLPRDLSRNPVFDVLFVMQNTGEAGKMEDITELNISPYPYENQMSKLDLTLQAIERETIQLELEYATQLFASQTAERIMQHYKWLLEQIVQTPASKLEEIELLSGEERQQLLEQFNDTIADYSKEKTIHGLFEEQVERTPDRVAVVLEEEWLTYRQLNERANRLARILRDKGVEADTIVGIMAERSLEMIVGIMAILKAGGAYLPIDPEYPPQRIQYMLEDSGTAFVLSHLEEVQLEVARGEIIRIQDVELAQGVSSNLISASTSSRLAYVMYTSGSTGTPKGVMIEHQSVINRIQWMQKKYPLHAADVILQKTSFSFDVSVWELFWWAIAGAQLCLLPPRKEKEPQQIVRAIAKHKVTTLHFVPSMLQGFVEHTESLQEAHQLSSVRHVFSSGEALGVQLVEHFHHVLTASNGTKLINLYGPTEATVDVSYFDCGDRKSNHHSIPIGRPIDNIQLYILNKHRQLVPLQVAGELYISGAGLARGYLNRPELTQERFVPNPFKPGEIMYRTGDVARWLPDGNIEYLGRLDHQVKIRGYRIELGEIEFQLQQLVTIKEAVVVARNDEESYLCAYVTASSEINTAEIRLQLAHQLPAHMIPSFIVLLEEMPLNLSGKLDRAALPRPQEHLELESYYAPRNEMEVQLIEVWKQVLGIEHMGITDNYFNLGGDSIKAIRLIDTIRNMFHVDIALMDLYVAPNIMSLSQIIADKRTQTNSMEDVQQINEVKNKLDKFKQELLEGTTWLK
ncbi:fengycin family lipopeptide synthetase D [Paenibacillus sp. DS2015]|uniref:amino acid adenylation domain-containing protein n=1 Tax=Paenibacillus sp. DS2015 TaxID=3373917 RepID=UPI003D1905DF